jgi:S-adenosylmethionine synthetase
VHVTVGYGEDSAPDAVEEVMVSTHHHDEVDVEQLRSDVLEHLIDLVLAPATPGRHRFHINPTGHVVIGGLRSGGPHAATQ